ncbi:MAG: alanine dehydrogenase [Caulobacter sp.]|nr:alanine dehydrogenase [Caulobacter sp.]
MTTGVPREIRTNEFRVGLTPGSVRELTARGHIVLVETQAGIGSGLTNVDEASSAWPRAEERTHRHHCRSKN